MTIKNILKKNILSLKFYSSFKGAFHPICYLNNFINKKKLTKFYVTGIKACEKWYSLLILYYIPNKSNLAKTYLQFLERFIFRPISRSHCFLIVPMGILPTL